MFSSPLRILVSLKPRWPACIYLLWTVTFQEREDTLDAAVRNWVCAVLPVPEVLYVKADLLPDWELPNMWSGFIFLIANRTEPRANVNGFPGL